MNGVNLAQSQRWIRAASRVVLIVFGVSVVILWMTALSPCPARPGNTQAGPMIASVTAPAVPHGLDSFGYTLKDSRQPGGPAYAWEEIASTGSQVTGWTSLDDGYAGPIPIGFDFGYYGNSYNELHVGSNGYLSFGQGYDNIPQGSPPYAGDPNNDIALFGGDMYLFDYGSSSVVYYQTLSNPTRFVLEFVNLYYCCGKNTPHTFEVILYPEGDILAQYRSLGGTSTSYVGIENTDGTDGLGYGAALSDRLAIRYYHPHRVLLTPHCQTGHGGLGELLAYEQTLANHTGVTDTFSLALGSHVWDTALLANTLGPLASGDAMTFTVYVTVPVDADWYSTDTVTVTATSVASPTVYSDTATLTTEAYAPPSMSISPEVLTSTQYVNEVVTRALTISNGNGVTLTFNIMMGADLARLVLWNKLGSDDEVLHSEVGENGAIVGTSYAYEPAMFGNGYVKKEYWQNYLRFPASILDRLTQRGAVELWVNPKVPQPVPYQYGVFGLLGSYYGHGGEPTDWSIGLFWGDTVTFQGLVGGIRFDGSLARTPDEPSQFVATPLVPFHAAISWDIAGIDGTADKVRVYRDGAVVGSTTDSWNPDGTQRGDIILNTTADSGGADKFIVDNIKIWDYAKTDFSDRFVESPVSAPWLSTEPVSGTVTSNSSTPVQVTFDATGLQPGDYTTTISMLSNDPVKPLVSVPVTMTVNPSANMGWAEGTITDAWTGAPLTATVIALGQPYTVTTKPDGTYKLWLDASSYTIQATAEGYVTGTAVVNIVAQQGVTQDFALELNVPRLRVSPKSMAVTHYVGDVTTRVLTITNDGPAPLTFNVGSQVTDAVLLMHLDEPAGATTFPDDSGHNNHGSCSGASCPTVGVDGKFGRALRFDGSDDYVEVGSPVPLALQIQNQLSLEAWIYATNYPAPDTLGTIVGCQYGDGTGASGYAIHLDGRTSPHGPPYISPPGHIHFQIGDGNWHMTEVNAQVPLDQWVHIVAVRKANEDAQVYYNGVQQPSASVPWSGSITYSGAELDVGRESDWGNRYFKGVIDEVAIYDRALCAQEVEALCLSGPGGKKVPWLSTEPVSGTVTTNSSTRVQVTFDATSLQPDTYTTTLVILSNDPVTPSVSVPVTMTVLPTANMGWVEGAVTDAATGAALTGTIVALGQPYTVTTKPDGTYKLWLEAGSYTLRAEAEGYATTTAVVSITAQQGTTHDFALAPLKVFLALILKNSGWARRN